MFFLVFYISQPSTSPSQPAPFGRSWGSFVSCPIRPSLPGASSKSLCYHPDALWRSITGPGNGKIIIFQQKRQGCEPLVGCHGHDQILVPLLQHRSSGKNMLLCYSWKVWTSTQAEKRLEDCTCRPSHFEFYRSRIRFVRPSSADSTGVHGRSLAEVAATV